MDHQADQNGRDRQGDDRQGQDRDQVLGKHPGRQSQCRLEDQRRKECEEQHVVESLALDRQLDPVGARQLPRREADQHEDQGQGEPQPFGEDGEQ